jgi:large subunit ribosomal protein L11
MGKKQTIEVMVDGGKASAGPPLGSSLGPMKVNVKAVVDEINKKTSSLAGMKVPVKVTVDPDDKSFEIEVGTPPISALIKKELSIKKGSKTPGTMRVADLSMEQVKKIAEAKFGSSDEPHLNQVKGTCRSMGITVGQGELTEEEKKKYAEMEKAAAAAAAAAPAEAGAEAEEKPKEEKKEEKKKEEKKK